MKNTVLFSILLIFLIGYIVPQKVSAQSEPQRECVPDYPCYPVVDSELQIEVLEDANGKLVYKTIENGQSFLYEEYTSNDTVSTDKYLMAGSKKVSLVERYNTDIKTNLNATGQEVITLTTKDLVNNVTSEQNFNIVDFERDSQNSSELMLSPDYEKVSINEASSKNKWVKSYGTRMGYYLYSNGGGLARYSTMEKKRTSYNSYFDTYTRNVDSLRALEVGALRDFIGIGLLEAISKAGPKLSLSKIKLIAIKFLKKIPIISIVVSLGYYLVYYDRANKAWLSIPGSYYRW